MLGDAVLLKQGVDFDFVFYPVNAGVISIIDAYEAAHDAKVSKTALEDCVETLGLPLGSIIVAGGESKVPLKNFYKYIDHVTINGTNSFKCFTGHKWKTLNPKAPCIPHEDTRSSWNCLLSIAKCDYCIIVKQLKKDEENMETPL